jgi:hypothetical protein
MALPYVSRILDEALSADHPLSDIRSDAVLVGWRCGFEPLFIAVQSYIPGVVLTTEEAEEIATDWLIERKWFSGEPREADYVIGGL